MRKWLKCLNELLENRGFVFSVQAKFFWTLKRGYPIDWTLVWVDVLFQGSTDYSFTGWVKTKVGKRFMIRVLVT